MGLFRKRPDPISDRARALNDQIAALEAQIKHLAEQPAKPHPQPQPAGQPQPRLRSTALPHGQAAPQPPLAGPILEEADQERLKHQPESAPPEHFNELGVRKYDLTALWQRVKNHFRGPSTSNPKLVSYLAAGSIQGLRPLRYEKRVARNRFLVLVVILILFLWGVIAIFIKHN